MRSHRDLQPLPSVPTRVTGRSRVGRSQVQSAELRFADGNVEVRLVELNGRWLASADTPDGPTLGCGDTSFEALWMCLKPYEHVIGELLSTMPAFGDEDAP